MSENTIVVKAWNDELVKISRYAIRVLDNTVFPINPVIVFDIDETLIDVLGNAIQPICTIYHYARMLGISIAVITARANVDIYVNIVKAHLAKLGISDVIRWYFRDPANLNYALYKEQARCDLVNSGYTVVMSVGDMDWDITGKHTGVPIKVPTLSSILNISADSSFQIITDTELEEKLFESLFCQLADDSGKIPGIGESWYQFTPIMEGSEIAICDAM